MDKNKKLHDEEIKIANYFVEICKKNNLQYFMMGGTLLGAIRHKGFIPWDDDMDFALSRKDYERLYDILMAENNSEYIIKHYKLNNNKDYPMKIESNVVQLKDTSTGNEIIRNVWIDIFPLDGMPSNRIKLNIKKIKLLVLRALFKLSQLSQVSLENHSRSKLEKLIIKLGEIFKLEYFINEKKMLNYLDKELTKDEFESSDIIVNFMGAYKFKEMFPKEIYMESMLFEFEDIYLNGPKNYDTVLSQMYGDYMELPNIDERNKHNTEIIDE